MNIMKQQRAEFHSYLKKNLNAEAYDQLHLAMNITKAKWSRLLSGTDDFNFVEIVALSNITGLSTIDLIQDYGLGASVITINEASQLGAHHGLTLEYVPHIA